VCVPESEGLGAVVLTGEVRLLHCCNIIVTLLLHYSDTVVTLLLHCCYTVVALLLYCR
jgi:hypothetical protein